MGRGSRYPAVALTGSPKANKFEAPTPIIRMVYGGRHTGQDHQPHQIRPHAGPEAMRTTTSSPTTIDARKHHACPRTSQTRDSYVAALTPAPQANVIDDRQQKRRNHHHRSGPKPKGISPFPALTIALVRKSPDSNKPTADVSENGDGDL